MIELPKIIIGEQGIENWDEIYRWAIVNDPLWYSCQHAYKHLSKERFLETLTAHQLQANVEITKTATEFAKRAPGWNFDRSSDV